MDGILKVTPEQLIQTAGEFESNGSTIRNQTTEMTQIVDSLKSVWEGEAAQAYSTKFHQLDDDMQRIYRMIDEHAKDLKEMARQYQEAEKTNQETANSLAGDVIN